MKRLTVDLKSLWLSCIFPRCWMTYTYIHTHTHKDTKTHLKLYSLSLFLCIYASPSPVSHRRIRHLLPLWPWVCHDSHMSLLFRLIVCVWLTGCISVAWIPVVSQCSCAAQSGNSIKALNHHYFSAFLTYANADHHEQQCQKKSTCTSCCEEEVSGGADRSRWMKTLGHLFSPLHKELGWERERVPSERHLHHLHHSVPNHMLRGEKSFKLAQVEVYVQLKAGQKQH